MLHPSPWREGWLSLLILILILPVFTEAGPGIFSHSCSHIWPEIPLYNHDNGYVRREKNGDLLIRIPDAASGKYTIAFFDGRDHLLFRIRRIKDTLLIVERYNFRHAGLFLYELYKDNVLLEQNTFFIKKDL